jgi:hypothetical protein
LNKNPTKLNALSDERQDTFIKTYDQLCLLVINEVSLVGNKMLFFINNKLHIIKQVQYEFMGGLNVIMIGDFYQAPLVQNSWIFKPITNIFNTIALNYWLKYVQCYELQEVMRQDDVNFINILNRFKTASQIIENIKCMNNNC